MSRGAPDPETRAPTRRAARLDMAAATVRDEVSPSSSDSASRPSGGSPLSPLRRGADARLLERALATPRTLLLDEPTNHLDIPSLEWLEAYLGGLDASIVLVAHDRWFLEAVGTSVLELEAGRGRYFSGPWHAWRTEQASREIALGKAIDRQQAEIERMERFVERFRYKATKARQAQSRSSRSSASSATPSLATPRRRKLRFLPAAERPAGGDQARGSTGRKWRRTSSMDRHAVERASTSSSSVQRRRQDRPIDTLAGAETRSGEGRDGHRGQLGYLSARRAAAGARDVLEAASADRPHRPEGPRPPRRVPVSGEGEKKLATSPAATAPPFVAILGDSVRTC